MEKLLRAFVATSADGTTYRICEYQEFEKVAGTYVPGWKDLRTADGEEVSRISTGVYDLILPMGNVRLTSDDPTAP